MRFFLEKRAYFELIEKYFDLRSWNYDNAN